MRISWPQAAAAVALLGAFHLGLAWLPGATLTPSINLALFATNVYVLYCAAGLLDEKSGRKLGLFVAGYLVLFLLIMVILDRKPLFMLLVVAYASVFRSRFLLGFFSLFVLSFVVLQPYAVESFVPLLVIYVTLWRLRSSSRFLWLCLGAGLLGLAVVLLPLLHLATRDSAQTLWHTATRPDVQEALWISVASSTVATLIVVVWGVPLAYALARLEFPGKRVVETLIDVPILVPQSVVGIALMVLLGRGSPLGEALDEILGIQLAGRFAGIVVAQVFVASPFLIKTAMTAFESVPARLELASRTLGASAARTFWRVAIPLAARGITVGSVLAWARAVSEFGSLVLFAASPVSAPLMVHNEFLRAGAPESRPIATLLLIVCLWLFVVLQFAPALVPRALRRGSAPAHPPGSGTDPRSSSGPRRSL
jgi:molybdate/tungstate transport system permease protein